MYQCGIYITDRSKGCNVLYSNIIKCYPNLFPEAGYTIITERILNRICADLNGSKSGHRKGVSLPEFRHSISVDSITYGTRPPYLDFV